MSQKCKYVAIDGTTLRFGYDGVLFMGAGDLRDFSFTPYAPYGKLLGFENESVLQKQVPLYISAPKKQSAAIRNSVFEVFDKDVRYKQENPLTEKSGKLLIGDYYLNCFISASSSSGFLTNSKILKKQLTIVTDYPYWIKEEKWFFSNETSEEAEEVSKRYPYKYPYRYRESETNLTLDNSYFADCNFQFIITARENSELTDPYIVIGGNTYQFNIIIKEGEQLIVNSLKESIVHIDSYGIETNALYARNKATDIFKRIPSGNNAVSLSDNARFEVTLFQERSEPEWN